MTFPTPRAVPYRLVVFDWDGTLMDSIGTIVACTVATMRDLGISGVAEETVRATIGLGLVEAFDTLYPGSSPEERQRVLDRYRHHWIETYHRRSLPVAGAIDTLDTLAAAGYWLAVATGKSRQGLDRDFASTGLGPRFLATRTVSEAPSKPNPQMLLDLMDELGVRPEETVMVGDTSFDLEMARSAGSTAVGVLTGSHPRETLVAAGALECLESVAGLPGWLAGRG